MIIHDIQPGPQVMTKNPDLFWGLIVSMWIGNLMLVILNLPLIGIWVKLLSVPYRLLFPVDPLVLHASAPTAPTTTCSTSGSPIVFGVLGYVFVKLGCEPAPLLLGFILGPMMEENLRRALVLSRGDFSVFVTRPISLVMLLVAVGLLVLIILPAVRKTRERCFRRSRTTNTAASFFRQSGGDPSCPLDVRRQAGSAVTASPRSG